MRIPPGLAAIPFLATLGLMLAACTGPAPATPTPTPQPSPISQPRAAATLAPAPLDASSPAPTQKGEGIAVGDVVLDQPTVSSAVAVAQEFELAEEWLKEIDEMDLNRSGT